MDVILYACALPALRETFTLSDAALGSVASATLLTAAVGGALFGVLADHWGRKRLLSATLLTYSLASAGTATVGLAWFGAVSPLAQLIFWRAMMGAGMGGEWACGAALVAEAWPPRLRDRAMAIMQSGMALGYLLAVLLSAFILPRWGWRVLFCVGALPALLVVWVRKHVPETLAPTRGAATGSSWDMFGRAYRPVALRTMALLVCCMIAYWGLFTWLPGFLARPVSQGGAGLGHGQSAANIVPMQLGALCGYLAFPWFVVRLGRRPALTLFLACTVLLTPLYGQLAAHPDWLMLVGPPLGFFGSGYFSVFATLISDAFPQRLRGGALGLIYNCSRAISACGPLLIGALADRFGVGTALGGTAFFALVAAALVWTLPQGEGGEAAVAL